MKGIVTEISATSGAGGEKTIHGVTDTLRCVWRAHAWPAVRSEFELDPVSMEVEWESCIPPYGPKRGLVQEAKALPGSGLGGAVTSPAKPATRAGLPPADLWRDVESTAERLGVTVEREQDENHGWYLIVTTGRGKVRVVVDAGWDLALQEAGLLDVSF